MSPPKADTGTLEARIEKALSPEASRDGEPVVRDEFARVLLRDALTELRQLRWQRDSEQAKLSATLTELAEARASSPDLRALVEKWRRYALMLRSDSEVMRDDRVKAMAMEACADELEASLTGTGEQK